MKTNSKASAAVTATLISAAALLGWGSVLASEPVHLSQAQMDAVTAGGALALTSAAGVAVGGETLALTDTAASTSVKNKKNAKASSGATAIAAGNSSAGTDIIALSEVSGDTAHAGVVATTSGEASEDGPIVISTVDTSAKQTGVVYKATGTATTYVDGDDVTAEATVVPYGEGALVWTTGSSTASTTESGQVTASGSIMVVDAPGLRGRSIPGKK